MIYSVWNQGKGSYDYYQSPDVQYKANTPKPSHLRATKLGLTVNQAAWPLPGGSRMVGSGPYAKGRIASLAGDSAMDSNVVGIIGLGIVAFLLWKSGFLKKV